MIGAVPILDLIGALAFAAAAIVIALTPSAPNQRFNGMAKTFTILSFTVYVFVLGVGVIDVFPEGSVVEQLEDFVEVLFPIFTLMAVSFDYSGQQAADFIRGQRAMHAAHEFMLGIVDAAPAGILLIDDQGGISFANDTARDTLDLAEKPEGGAIMHPAWTVRDPGGGERHDMRALTEHVGEAQRLVIEWATGWTIELMVHTEFVSSEAGVTGGVVATFERPSNGG